MENWSGWVIVSGLPLMSYVYDVDVFSVPSPYAEPKGLYLLEAMANAVPWVQPRHGAFVEMELRTQGGLLFEPNDAQDLAARIMALVDDPHLAARLGRQGAEGVQAHYTATKMADRTIEVCEQALSPAKRPRAAAAGA